MRPINSRSGKKINSCIGKAVFDHNMIEDGDRVLVAVSGGKSSLTLLKMLTMIRTWAPVEFDIVAVHLTEGGCDSSITDKMFIKEYFGGHEVDIRFKDIGICKYDDGLYKGAGGYMENMFLRSADEFECGKIALGHNKDDIVEAMISNILCNGEIRAMEPKRYMEDDNKTIIRPLCYVEEKLIIEYCKGHDIKVCGHSFYGNDAELKGLIREFIREASTNTRGTDVKTNIMRSTDRVKTEYLDIK